ncbi:ABC transporter ATP-binding protein [Leptotrichia sp. OH3620_COT-345]|uniref:ABC transporter ATP-binding protein n=1 Tax=Leptotrichia sp. OH3620_COT-345 TaxID=2491048 RepID=UPI000F647EA7|nr:ABC transporter ATP-binding protein [Leptotrichia sp. OH3620_COT-345]RRD40419.1 ABC transporter ATP-binding protein [Leptotrichia sp. OH3620_COT-345]
MIADIFMENVEFSYNSNEEKLLSDINLNIKKGKFTGILGPNGCGKSTLLKIILKYLPSHEGIIKIENKKLKDYNQSELSKLLSFVPQKSSLSMPLTVEEVVYMGRVPYIKNKWSGFEKEDDEKVTEVIKKLDLEKFRKRNAFSLSGGEFQRVLLARALVQNTKIILLDEPTSALDMNYALEIMKITSQFVKKENITAVMVLHDLNLAALYCDNLIFLKKGKIMYKGTPKELFRPEIFQEIYGFGCKIIEHNGYPYVIPDKI